MHSISATYIKPFIKPLANLICITLLYISPTRHCERSEAIQTLLEKSKRQACNPHGYWSAGRLLFNLNAKKQRVMITNGEWRHEENIVSDPIYLGSDNLFGGAGEDWMFGGGGDDYLIGGTGNDSQFGEAANDNHWRLTA